MIIEQVVGRNMHSLAVFSEHRVFLYSSCITIIYLH